MDAPSPPKDEADKPAFVIALDIGTTSLRSHVYDKHGKIKGTDSKKVYSKGQTWQDQRHRQQKGISRSYMY